MSLRLDKRRATEPVFNADGSVRHASIKIVNVKRHSDSVNKWEEVSFMKFEFLCHVKQNS